MSTTLHKRVDPPTGEDPTSRQCWEGSSVRQSAVKGVVEKRVKGGVRAVFGFALLALCLFSFSLFTSARAQAIEAATLLSPWPPLGWPEGAQGEVRLVGGDDPSAYVDVLGFPIQEDGSIVYKLPESLPKNLPAGIFLPLVPTSKLFTFCQGIAPVISPTGVEFAVFSFSVYADGELWGSVEMEEIVSTGLVTGDARSVAGVVYASAPVTVTGGGTCPDGTVWRFDLALDEGPQLLEARVSVGLTSFTALLGTTRTFDLPQRLVAFGSE